MGDAVPEMSVRQTATVFSAATTGYVRVKVSMAFDAPQRALHALLSCRILQDRTRELGRMTLAFDIRAEWRSAWAARGYGRSSPEIWAPGNYLVACDDGRRTLAQASFEFR